MFVLAVRGCKLHVRDWWQKNVGWVYAGTAELKRKKESIGKSRLRNKFRFSSLWIKILIFVCVPNATLTELWFMVGCWNDVHERDGRKRLANDDDGEARLRRFLSGCDDIQEKMYLLYWRIIVDY